MQPASHSSWFCPLCGHQNQLSFKHCTECGTMLPIGSPMSSVMPIVKRSEGLSLFWWAVFGFIGLIIIVSMLGVILTRSIENKRVGQTETIISSERTEALKPVATAPSEKSAQNDKLASARQHVNEFNTSLSAPAIKAYMTDAKLSELSSDDLEVTVSARWHYEPKAIRLQMAQVIWKAWAGIHSPNQPDSAYLTLRDAVGNKVGGSRVTGGSFIWVAD